MKRKPEGGDSLASMNVELDDIEEYIDKGSPVALRMSLLALRAQVALVTAIEALRRDLAERPR